MRRPPVGIFNMDKSILLTACKRKLNFYKVKNSFISRRRFSNLLKNQNKLSILAGYYA